MQAVASPIEGSVSPGSSTRSQNLAADLSEHVGLPRIVGQSPALALALHTAMLVARHPVPALITGETGTGKEAIARAIHQLSPRSNALFVPVNCGALPAELVENEFFGHVSGAYTGANRAAEGLVAQAEGGTLFLDEIDTLPAAAQVKLLRLIQEKEYRSVGSTQTRTANVRIIAAANSDLPEGIRQGRFRADLYYRLNVMPIVLPPLRERTEDLQLLAAHFVKKYAAEFGTRCLGVSAAALAKLAEHPWPGNIRELENVIQRAVLSAVGSQVEIGDLSWGASSSSTPAMGLRSPAAGGPRSSVPLNFRALKARAVSVFERDYLTRLLQTYHGNITHAANAAGKNRRAFWELLRKHGLTSAAGSR